MKYRYAFALYPTVAYGLSHQPNEEPSLGTAPLGGVCVLLHCGCSNPLPARMRMNVTGLRRRNFPLDIQHEQ